jgi:hypothetical protein
MASQQEARAARANQVTWMSSRPAVSLGTSIIEGKPSDYPGQMLAGAVRTPVEHHVATLSVDAPGAADLPERQGPVARGN